MNRMTLFETQRLLLRGITLKDAGAYELHFNNYEVVSHLGAEAVPWPLPPGSVMNFLRKKVIPRLGIDRWMWGLFRKTHPGELIGVVDLWRPGRPENRGFWLGRSFWDRGYMTEAVIPVTSHAFDELGFENLAFSNAVGNARSRRIKEKIGARFVGTEPFTFIDPHYTKRELWELTREDWDAWKRRAP